MNQTITKFFSIVLCTFVIHISVFPNHLYAVYKMHVPIDRGRTKLS